MELNGQWFTDSKTKQTILFKGINLGGGTKLPTGLSSHDRDGYWVDYDRKVSFIGRPFPLNEADEHLSRLANLGFNLLRFIITWEAVEHEGPGIYDQDYLDYVVAVLKKCKEYEFHVYIDPHQDCWSRHCGGSGHPGWTLTLVGLDPIHFPETNAAIVHNLYPKPENYPKMIWNTNYQKLATATLFTLFFAGKIYAPKCIINGVNVQDYLQQHYFNCFKKVATIIHENELENNVVIGYDTMNEPGQGYLSINDITKLNQQDTDFKMGLMPTAFQGMLLGSGIPTQVEYWEFKWNGPKKTSEILVDPNNVTVWLNEAELIKVDDVFGWKRSSCWSPGCIWENHGVWNKSTQQVLLPEYFKSTTTKYIDFWINHVENYANAIRSIHLDAILFVQSPILEIPPKLPFSLKRLVYSPHWYDGLTLVKKKWCNYNVDFINLNRGKYGTGPLRFLRALRLGEKSIRQCFVEQLKTIQTEGLENIGEYPCIIGEIGIPFDMESDTKNSLLNWFNSFFYFLNETITAIGNPTSSQNRAMDASINALEKNLLNYTLWNYTSDNNEQWGDEWNGEDLSIWQQSVITSAPTLSSLTVVQVVDKKVDNDSLSSTASNVRNVRNARNLVCLHRPHPRITAGIPISINFVSPTENTCASFEYIFKQNTNCDGPTEIHVPICYFPTKETKVNISVGKCQVNVVNNQYWILSWWIDDNVDGQEVKLSLEGTKSTMETLF